MDATAGAPTIDGQAMDGGAPRAAQVFLSDTRLALTLLNHGRYFALQRVFGVPRDQVNLLSFVIALSAAGGAYETGRRLAHARLPFTGSDVAFGGVLVREGVFGIVGPSAREVPLAGTLLAGALVAGVALPGVRRALHNIRAAEHRVRERRMRIYAAAARAAQQARAGAT